MKFLSPRAVAFQLGTSYSAALRIMRAAGAVKLGSLVRVREDVLNAYLDQCRVPETQPESTKYQDEIAGMPTSAANKGLSLYKPRTKPKRSENSPKFSLVEDYNRALSGNKG